MKCFFCWAIPVILLAACQMGDGDYSYKKMVEHELASGKTADSLLLAIRFGMSRKEFYDYCWEMHNKGQFEDGSNSTAVLYRVHSGLKHTAFMNFFPDFYKDSIYKMWAKFQYEAWAPWNKNLCSDSLMADVLHLYKDWYPGNDFIKMTDPVKGTIYIKVDGNRRIVVGKPDDMHVNVDYTDLRVEPKIKK